MLSTCELLLKEIMRYGVCFVTRLTGAFYDTMGVLLKAGAFFSCSGFPEGIVFRQLTLLIESQAAINK